MDAELKAKWIGALRSGNYKQGKTRFEYDDKFCCLGVLCVVAGQPTVILDRGHGNWAFANEAVGDGVATRLADMNDDGTPFPMIADYIEANL